MAHISLGLTRIGGDRRLASALMMVFLFVFIKLLGHFGVLQHFLLFLVAVNFASVLFFLQKLAKIIRMKLNRTNNFYLVDLPIFLFGRSTSNSFR